MFLSETRHTLKLALASIAILLLSGCSSWIYEDIDECPSGLNLRFVFNYNLLEADAFSSQVKSVHVWVFDDDGNFVWSGAENGSILAEPGYIMSTPLEAGTYNLVSWCGLDDNADFDLQTYQPRSREELEVRLKAVDNGGQAESSSRFKNLFHGVTEFSYAPDPMRPSIKTVTVPLVKDTNTIAVMLSNLDGTAIDSNDFTASITYADSWLAWDNQVETASPTITYKPWSTLYGQTSLSPIDQPQETVRTTLLYEFSMSRLLASGEKAWLDVVRVADNIPVIHVPIIDYFLIEKGNRYDRYDNQEYLDRRDDYSALFFLDADHNWYMAAGVYINSWAIVPPQYNKF